jgi:hypothetical protein
VIVTSENMRQYAWTEDGMVRRPIGEFVPAADALAVAHELRGLADAVGTLCADATSGKDQGAPDYGALRNRVAVARQVMRRLSESGRAS